MDPRLEEACHTGNLSMFHSLLQEDKLLLHRFSSSITASIENPLHIAASLGHTDLANEIIIRNPDLSSVLNPRALSALHLASAHGHLEIVKLLISNVGTHLCFLKGRDGRLAIHIAAMKGRIDILEELIKLCPGSARALTYQHESILHIAVQFSSFKTVDFLVKKLEVDDDINELFNLKDDKGNTILHHAVARRQLQSVKLLLRKGEVVEVNAMNHKGLTALDVLLDSPIEHGDLTLGEVIRAAGGKKASEMDPQQTSLQTNTSRNESSGTALDVIRTARGKKASEIHEMDPQQTSLQTNTSRNESSGTVLDVPLDSPIEHGEVIRTAGGEMDPQQTSLQTNTSRNESSGTILDVPLDSPIEHGEVIRTASGEITSRNESSGTVLDVPLDSPIEHGEVIRTPGGEMDPQQTSLQTNTSRNESSGTTPPSRSRRRTRLQRSTPGEVEDNYTPSTLMVVATIIVTITFQAGLNPPGGFNQDTSPAPGVAVLRSKLSYFLLYDLIGLVASFSMILILIFVGPTTKKIMIWKMLMLIMWVAVLSTALAFSAAIFKIFRDPNKDTNQDIILILTWCWYGILDIFSWVVFSRDIVYLLRKVGWWRKKEGDGVSNIVRNGGYPLLCERIGAVMIILLLLAFLCLINFIPWVYLREG